MYIKCKSLLPLISFFIIFVSSQKAMAQDPCLSITNIICGQPTVVNFAGAAGVWNSSMCGFTVPGEERIFSFTPQATGTYSINVTSVTGGWYVDYAYKVASGGCTSTGWTCIDDVNSAVVTPFGPLTAGVTYYILLDDEDQVGGSHTFQINCLAPDACAGITNISCGSPVSASFSGAGQWNTTSCFFTTSGQERIYSFTPVATGAHTLQVTSANGGYVDYFIKAASGGCSLSGWTCISDNNGPETDALGTLTAGTEYYILLDAEPTTAVNHTFQIDCLCPPAPTASPLNIVINPGQIVQYTTTGIGNFQWYNSGGSLLSTGNSYLSPVIYTATNFSVRDFQGCLGAATPLVVTIKPSATFAGRKAN